jgi:O-antigen/teichoic acid export membrane protein
MKEDIRKIFSDYSVLLINKYIFTIVSFFSTFLLTRILGKNGYGQFSLFYLVANIAFVASIGWTSNAVLRFGKEEFIKEQKLNKVFWARNSIIFIGLAISIASILIFKNRLENYTQIKFIHLFIIIFLIFQTLLDYIGYIFQATGKLKVSAFFEILPKVFFTLFLFMFFLANKKDITQIFIVFIIAQFLTLLLSAKWISFSWFCPVTVDRAFLKEILSFSYPLIFSSLSAYVVNYIDLIFIRKYYLISDVGVYSFAYNMMGYFKQIIMAVITVTGPILIGLVTQDREDVIKSYIHRLIPQGIFFWSIFLIISILFMPYILPVVFGNDFKDSILLVQILLCGLVYNGISCFYSGVLTTFKLIKEAVFINVCMAILNFIGDLLLVPLIGAIGAAISSAVVFSLGGIAYMYIGNRRLGIKENKSLIFIIPVALVLITSLYKLNFIFAVFPAGLFYYLVLSKSKLFKKSDTSLLDKISIPIFFKRTIYGIYNFFSFK